MSKATYHPDRGDIIHLNLAPSAGHELSGDHFALVISSKRFARATGFAIVVPGTSRYHHERKYENQQLMVRLPELAKLNKEGWLYTHQFKSIDYRDRRAAYVTRVDDDFLIEIMDRVRALIDPDSIA